MALRLGRAGHAARRTSRPPNGLRHAVSGSPQTSPGASVLCVSRLWQSCALRRLFGGLKPCASAPGHPRHAPEAWRKAPNAASRPGSQLGPRPLTRRLPGAAPSDGAKRRSPQVGSRLRLKSSVPWALAWRFHYRRDSKRTLKRHGTWRTSRFHQAFKLLNAFRLIGEQPSWRRQHPAASKGSTPFTSMQESAHVHTEPL